MKITACMFFIPLQYAAVFYFIVFLSNEIYNIRTHCRLLVDDIL